MNLDQVLAILPEKYHPYFTEHNNESDCGGECDFAGLCRDLAGALKAHHELHSAACGVSNAYGDTGGKQELLPEAIDELETEIHKGWSLVKEIKP